MGLCTALRCFGVNDDGEGIVCVIAFVTSLITEHLLVNAVVAVGIGGHLTRVVCQGYEM